MQHSQLRTSWAAIKQPKQTNKTWKNTYERLLLYKSRILLNEPKTHLWNLNNYQFGPTNIEPPCKTYKTSKTQKKQQQNNKN